MGKLDVYMDESQRIASTIFPEILQENKKLGIPTPIGIGGKIYFIMPDGNILRVEDIENSYACKEDSGVYKNKNP